MQQELEKQNITLKELQRKYALEGLEKEIYEEYKSEVNSKIAQISGNLKKTESKISNLDNYINVSVKITKNISKYWASESLDTKKRIQELVFPSGLVIDTKKRSYLTKKRELGI